MQVLSVAVDPLKLSPALLPSLVFLCASDAISPLNVAVPVTAKVLLNVVAPLTAKVSLAVTAPPKVEPADTFNCLLWNAAVFVTVVIPAKVDTPAVTTSPPVVTLIPFPAVTNPTESTFVTSSYVNVPPTDTFPPTYKLLPIPTPPLTCNAPVVVDDAA